MEIPLPDRDARLRLLRLYSRGLRLEVDDLGPVVARTEGVTASFITELLRKAALLAALDAEPAGRAADPLVVSGRHLDAALDELTAEGARLTRALLGEGRPERGPVLPGSADRARPGPGLVGRSGDSGWYAYAPAPYPPG